MRSEYRRSRVVARHRERVRAHVQKAGDALVETLQRGCFGVEIAVLPRRVRRFVVEEDEIVGVHVGFHRVKLGVEVRSGWYHFHAD